MRLLVIKGKSELSVKGRATLVVNFEDKVIERPLRDIDVILIIGKNKKIRSSVPPVLSLHNIPLAIIAMDYISILMNPIGTRYNNYRRLQYCIDKVRALDIALEYIKSKIRGFSNIVNYYKKIQLRLPELPERSKENPESYEENIRIWESISSNLLWDYIVNLIDKNYLEVLKNKYEFTGRKPRHADPFNKTLSVMYAVLYSLATKALIAAGLDPTYGFLHRTRYSTPLTFDYTEMFKPIAVQATINAINSEGLPQLDDGGELTTNSINTAIQKLYAYLTLRHKDTGKSIYQYIYLKAYCLARHLEGKCPTKKLTIVWNRKNFA